MQLDFPNLADWPSYPLVLKGVEHACSVAWHSLCCTRPVWHVHLLYIHVLYTSLILRLSGYPGARNKYTPKLQPNQFPSELSTNPSAVRHCTCWSFAGPVATRKLPAAPIPGRDVEFFATGTCSEPLLTYAPTIARDNHLPGCHKAAPVDSREITYSFSLAPSPPSPD